MSVCENTPVEPIAIDEPKTVSEQDELDTTFSARTSNATLFYSWEAPNGYRMAGRRESFRQFYRRLWGYHTGLYNGWWEDAKKINRLQKTYLLDMFASHLELTPGQRAQAESYLRTTISDMRKFKVSNVRTTETILLALCAYVSTKDGRNCHPNHEQFDDLFEEVRTEVSIRQKDYASAYGKIEQAVLRNQYKEPPEREKQVQSLNFGQKWPAQRGI